MKSKILTGLTFVLFVACLGFIWRLNATKEGPPPSQAWLNLDYCFIVVYTAFSICLCLKGRELAPTLRWKQLGGFLAWLMLATALFDVAENLIQGHVWNPSNFESLLQIFGVLKFLGPTVALIYFILMHPGRAGIARAGLGFVILAIAALLWIRIFKGHVAVYEAELKPGPDTDQLEQRLRANIEQLVRNHPAHVYGTYTSQLSATAAWIMERFRTNGPAPATVADFPFSLEGSQKLVTNAPSTLKVANIVAQREGTQPTNGIIVIGAHYDTMPFSSDWTGTNRAAFRPTEGGTPGANDNASGVAALLEIERALHGSQLKRTVRFVAFVNEEPPFFQNTNWMGSYRYAEHCRQQHDNILMMISLDALAVYASTNRDSIHRRQGRGLAAALWGLPDRTDYVAFMSNWDADSGAKAKDWAQAFARHATIAVRTSSLPFWSGEYFAWSDDWSFTRHGYPAFTVTDTAFYRSARYHTPDDTLENLSPADWRGYAAVVRGLIAMVKEMANQ